MSMIIGGATVAVIEFRGDSSVCDAYPNRLAAVLAMINNGSLGGSFSYGGYDHKAALAKVDQQLAATRASIARMEAIAATAEGWIALASARYTEAGGLTREEADHAATSLHALYCGGAQDLPEPAEAADDDMTTWGN